MDQPPAPVIGHLARALVLIGDQLPCPGIAAGHAVAACGGTPGHSGGRPSLPTQTVSGHRDAVRRRLGADA